MDSVVEEKRFTFSLSLSIFLMYRLRPPTLTEEKATVAWKVADCIYSCLILSSHSIRLSSVVDIMTKEGFQKLRRKERDMMITSLPPVVVSLSDALHPSSSSFNCLLFISFTRSARYLCFDDCMCIFFLLIFLKYQVIIWQSLPSTFHAQS